MCCNVYVYINKQANLRAATLVHVRGDTPSKSAQSPRMSYLRPLYWPFQESAGLLKFTNVD